MLSKKLLQLRKRKGLSQATLAEQLNTTREAINNWERSQGLPEIEKLMMIGNIFEVSLDYLLKDTIEQSSDSQKGYYVSREMAEGYVWYQRKTSQRIALGFSLLILSLIPYLVFKENPAMYTFLILVMATLGIETIVTTGFIDEDRYKILKKKTLIFDQNYLKELIIKYETLKKKYGAIMVAGICLFVIGVIPFLSEYQEFTLMFSKIYYSIGVFLITAGIYILIRYSIILKTYKNLLNNSNYMTNLEFKALKK